MLKISGEPVKASVSQYLIVSVQVVNIRCKFTRFPNKTIWELCLRGFIDFFKLGKNLEEAYWSSMLLLGLDQGSVGVVILEIPVFFFEDECTFLFGCKLSLYLWSFLRRGFALHSG